jgi:hypothetical protein
MNEQTRPSGVIRAVTKSDTTDVTKINGQWPRALLVGTAGTATVIDATGTTATSIPLQAGYNPISVQRVLDTGTAADIWALY